MAGLLDRHRGRVAVATAFLAHSLITGSWASRIPAIKHTLDLSDGQLGVALFGMAAGTLIGGRAGGVAAARLGARVAVRAGIPVFAATLVVAALAGDLTALTATMVVFGMMAATVDVAMNAEAVVVERASPRPLMSGFHGMWSLGLVGGALGGVLAAGLDASPRISSEPSRRDRPRCSRACRTAPPPPGPRRGDGTGGRCRSSFSASSHSAPS